MRECTGSLKPEDDTGDAKLPVPEKLFKRASHSVCWESLIERELSGTCRSEYRVILLGSLNVDG